MTTKTIQKNTKANQEKFEADNSKEDLIFALEESQERMVSLLDSIPEKRIFHKYDNDKWSIKQVFMHLIDSERVHAYRALRIARFDHTAMNGFDSNAYAEQYNAQRVSLPQIKTEFKAVRRSTIELFRNMNEDSLDNRGMGNNICYTPRVIGWVIAAHANHHYKMIKDKYL